MRVFAAAIVVSLATGACSRTQSAPAAGAAESGAVATSGLSSIFDREVTIPAGTVLPIALDTAVGSDFSRVEEPVRAHLTHAIAIDGQNVIPEGSAVMGVVTDATRSGKVKGRAHVALRFDSLEPRAGERYQIQTSAVGRTAPGTKKDDALKIGIPAAGGAIIGGLIGGGKGAAIGAVAGGGAGTAVVLETRGKEVRMHEGAAMSLRLVEPVTVKARE